MDMYHSSIFGFNTGIQFRTGYQNQAESSLEQGQVSGEPAAHPHQNFCSVPPPRRMKYGKKNLLSFAVSWSGVYNP